LLKEGRIKKMKRHVLFLLIILLIIPFTACTKAEEIPEGYTLRENHYHNIEYSKDKIYALYRWINPDDDNDWSNALWCFTPYEDAKLIAKGKGLDFRVSKNNEYIAVEMNGNIEFYNEEGKLLHTISSDVINTEEYTRVQIEQWNDEGDTLWCALMETYNTVAYISIDTKTWESVKYDGLAFNSAEYILNPNTGWVVYSDYPVMLDTIAVEQYIESNRLTTLSIYNLITKEEIDIETSEINKFRPKWSNDNEIVYYIGDKMNCYQLGED
jgi:hypothetical protein